MCTAHKQSITSILTRPMILLLVSYHSVFEIATQTWLYERIGNLIGMVEYSKRVCCISCFHLWEADYAKRFRCIHAVCRGVCALLTEIADPVSSRW